MKTRILAPPEAANFMRIPTKKLTQDRRGNSGMSYLLIGNASYYEATTLEAEYADMYGREARVPAKRGKWITDKAPGYNAKRGTYDNEEFLSIEHAARILGYTAKALEASQDTPRSVPYTTERGIVEYRASTVHEYRNDGYEAQRCVVHSGTYRVTVTHLGTVYPALSRRRK